MKPEVSEFIEKCNSLGYYKNLGDISWAFLLNPRVNSVFNWIVNNISKENNIEANFSSSDLEFYRNLCDKGLNVDDVK